MKIALYTETYPPFINGVATHASLLAEGLRRLGHEVLVVTADPAVPKHVVKNGVLRCPAAVSKKIYGYGLPNPYSRDAYRRYNSASGVPRSPAATSASRAASSLAAMPAASIAAASLLTVVVTTSRRPLLRCDETKWFSGQQRWPEFFSRPSPRPRRRSSASVHRCRKRALVNRVPVPDRMH